MWAVLIYELLHIIYIIRYFIVTQYVIGSLGDITYIRYKRVKKKQQNKNKQRNHTTPK